MYCAGHMTEDVWFLNHTGTKNVPLCFASCQHWLHCSNNTHALNTITECQHCSLFIHTNSDSMCVNGNQLQRKSRPCTDEPHYVPIIQPHRKDIQSNCTGWCTFDVHSVSLLTLNYGGMSEIEGRGINNFWHSQSCWGNVGFNKDCSRIISSNLSLKCF